MSTFSSSLLESTFRATAELFIVINIIAGIPLILSFKDRKAVIKPMLTTIASLVIMILFFFFGESMLKLVNIHKASFLSAGSIILFSLSVDLVFNVSFFNNDLTDAKSVAIIPIAFPTIAGMGTLTTIARLKDRYELVPLLLGMFINTVFIYFVLRYIERIDVFLGKKGKEVTKTIMGVLLMSIALQTFKTSFFNLESQPW